ncbi:hypothetical protein ACUZXZ_01170 [Pseudomonas juntendi]
MKKIAICLLLLASSVSAEQIAPHVEVIHDDKRAVTCWLYADYYRGSIGGISCIPDSQLQAGSELPLSSIQPEKGPTPATTVPQWNDERYSL